MLRLSRLSRCTAAAVLAQMQGPQPVTLDAVFTSLRDHESHGPVASAALPRLTALDVDDAASLAVARNHGVLVTTLRTHGSQDVTMAAHCCRAIANAALVPIGAASEPMTEEQLEEAGRGQHCASLLREAGAVGLVVAVLSRGPQLSPKGRAWAAMAIQNLVLLDDQAAAQAADANAEVPVAEVLRITLDQTTPESLLTDPAAAAAVEGCLATLARLLSLQYAEDSADVTFRYQRAPAVAIEAITAVLGRCEAAAKLGAPVEGIEHKAWEALRLLSAEAQNAPMLLAGLSRADGQAGRAILARWQIIAGSAPLHAPSSDDVFATLQHQMLLAGLDVLIEVTAPQDGADEALAQVVAAGAAAVAASRISSFVIALEARKDSLPTAAAPCPPAVLQLLSLHANLAEGDPDCVGPNAVAVVKPLLAAAKRSESGPIAEKAMAVLWNVLNHSSGADTWRTLELTPLVKAFSEGHPHEGAKNIAERLFRKATAVADAPRYVHRDGSVRPNEGSD